MPLTVHFLLVYSYTEGRLIRQEQFTDPVRASVAYNEAEREFRGCSDEFEVVLVGADSIDTVMRTHGHYFATSVDSNFSELLTNR